MKAQLFDHQVDLSLTAYYYKYLGLQVSNYNFVTHAISTTNGANAVTKGVEVDLNYRPQQVRGLEFNSDIAYNHAAYSYFPGSPCWGGQTAAQGCITDPTSGATYQNLAGHPTNHAPRWTGDIGADYEMSVTEAYSLALHTDVNFSSGYYTVADLLPDSYQKGYALLNAGIRFGKLDGPWEFAIIGRNLTNKYYIVGASDAGEVTPGVMADAFGFPARPRQIVFQITARPDLF